MSSGITKREKQDRAMVRAALLTKTDNFFNELERIVAESDNDVVKLKGIELFLEYVLGKAPVEVETKNLHVSVGASEQQRTAALKNYLINHNVKDVLENEPLKPRARAVVDAKKQPPR
jgi:hypothetical protein